MNFNIKLKYCIAFFFAAFVAYHISYYLWWASHLSNKVYATITFIIFLSLLYLCRRYSMHKRIMVCGGWFAGAFYAIAPCIILNSRFYEGLIAKWSNPFEYIFSGFNTDIEISLLNKWGQVVIKDEAEEFYYINKHTIVSFCTSMIDNEWVFELNVYEDFCLKKQLKLVAEYNFSNDCSLGDYIKKHYGNPLWSYRYNTRTKELDEWCINRIIEESGTDENGNPYCYEGIKLHEEDDGFIWYTYESDGLMGALNNKKDIIIEPHARNIIYEKSHFIVIYPIVTDKEHLLCVYEVRNQSGDIIIPKEKGYNTIHTVMIEGTDNYYFEVSVLAGKKKKWGKYYMDIYNYGLCDMYGKEQLPPIYSQIEYIKAEQKENDIEFKDCFKLYVNDKTYYHYAYIDDRGHYKTYDIDEVKHLKLNKIIHDDGEVELFKSKSIHNFALSIDGYFFNRSSNPMDEIIHMDENRILFKFNNCFYDYEILPSSYMDATNEILNENLKHYKHLYNSLSQHDIETYYEVIYGNEAFEYSSGRDEGSHSNNYGDDYAQTEDPFISNDVDISNNNEESGYKPPVMRRVTREVDCPHCQGGYNTVYYYGGNNQILTRQQRCVFCDGSGTLKESDYEYE